MSQYQLRVYTLRSPEALAAYEKIWARHIPGMAKHRITTHGVWTVPAAPASEAPRLYALVSYRDADEVQERLEAYLSSPEFRADVTPPPRERGGFSLCRCGFATDQPGP